MRLVRRPPSPPPLLTISASALPLTSASALLCDRMLELRL